LNKFASFLTTAETICYFLFQLTQLKPDIYIYLSPTDFGILRHKFVAVMLLTFLCRDVISHVPSDLHCAISYRCSVDTDMLS